MKTFFTAVAILAATVLTAHAQGYGNYSGFDGEGRYYHGTTYDNGFGTSSWSGFDSRGRYNYGSYNYRSYQPTYRYNYNVRTYWFSDAQRRRINRYYGFGN